MSTQYFLREFAAKVLAELEIVRVIWSIIRNPNCKKSSTEFADHAGIEMQKCSCHHAVIKSRFR